MSLMGSSQKRGLNIADLRSLISNNPRANISNKQGERLDGTPNRSQGDANRSQGDSYRSQGDTIRSQSDSLPEQLSSESQDDRSFFFPKVKLDEISPVKAKEAKNEQAIMKFSDLQRTRKTVQEHDDAIQKITSMLSGLSEDIKGLRSEVKSLKAEVKYCCDHQKESSELTTSQVLSLQNNSNKISTVLDKILVSQEVLRGSVTELAAISKTANVESLLRKRFSEHQQQTDKSLEGVKMFLTELIVQKFEANRQEMESMRDLIKTRSSDEDYSSSFDDLTLDVALGDERVAKKRRKEE